MFLGQSGIKNNHENMKCVRIKQHKEHGGWKMKQAGVCRKAECVWMQNEEKTSHSPTKASLIAPITPTLHLQQVQHGAAAKAAKKAQKFPSAL